MSRPLGAVFVFLCSANIRRRNDNPAPGCFAYLLFCCLRQVFAAFQKDQPESTQVVVSTDSQRPLLPALADAVHHPPRSESK